MCDWAGLAALGTADRPQRDSWYNASSGCVVLAQEPGHNFGMVHSSSLSCTAGGAKVPLALPGSGTCAHSEYGNSFDPMGGGCYHMDGFQKAYQDWLTGCNVVKVTTSGTFTIFPLEKACNGVQLLQIPFQPRTMMLTNGPTVSISNYYLELRAPIGVDSALTPRVFVTVGGNIAEARGRGGRNWLLDMTNETTTKTDAALPVGRMYTDPGMGGPKFTVVSADATKAVIRVEAAGGAPASDQPGAGLCDDGSAFMAPGPDTCDAPPVTAPAPDGGATTPDARAPSGDGGTGSGGTGGSTGGSGGSQPDPNGSGGSTGARDSGVSPPMPAPDAEPATPEQDAGGTTDPQPAIHGACGCHLGGPTGSSGALLVSLGFAALVLARRRRR
jgi:MYXO-CTERM domain-containing protein